MSKYRIIPMILIPALILTNLIPAISVFAQELKAFGEIKPEGKVYILSSTGKWEELKNVYPLLKQTKLRIEDGTVFITTKNGSKIDLLKNTEAVVNVTNSTYTIDILNCTGNLFFNMIPTEVLTVTTPETTHVIIQKVDVPSPTNIQGTILNKDTGTEVKSIFGKILVSHHGLKPEELNTGDNKFVGGECIAIGGVASAGTKPAGAGAGMATGGKIITGLTVGLFVTGATIAAFEAFRGGKVASPSVPK